MTDDMLSQDEIDALLNGGGGDDSSAELDKDKKDTPEAERLSVLEEDALGKSVTSLLAAPLLPCLRSSIRRWRLQLRRYPS